MGDNFSRPLPSIKFELEGVATETMEKILDQFDTCARPQGVLKSEPAGDNGSEDSPLGAFILAAVEILVETDLEVQDDEDTNG